MENGTYPSYWTRRTHRSRHRRPTAFLPSANFVGRVLLYTGLVAFGGIVEAVATGVTW